MVERGEGFPLSLDLCVGMNGDREGGEEFECILELLAS